MNKCLDSWAYDIGIDTAYDGDKWSRDGAVMDLGLIIQGVLQPEPCPCLTSGVGRIQVIRRPDGRCQRCHEMSQCDVPIQNPQADRGRKMVDHPVERQEPGAILSCHLRDAHMCCEFATGISFHCPSES
jgi:hypothetical protein